ncbi:MAG: hypothetical protein JRF57_07590 [Deltaproteobacteria bacterium]|nr:hypothetical protein [Deltaproteobacteria bacterium]
MILEDGLRRTLRHVAEFYDRRKVGDVGPLGFRRSTDLGRLLSCLEPMVDNGLLVPGRSLFLDLGAGDGRVNVLFSYLVRLSAGIELDEWTLDEYCPLKGDLESELAEAGLSPPPENLFLLNGDSTDESLHKALQAKTGFAFKDFDLFYTYLTMIEEFADLIARKAKPGAVFMAYGLEKVIPRLPGLELLTPEEPLQGILGLYRKPL